MKEITETKTRYLSDASFYTSFGYEQAIANVVNKFATLTIPNVSGGFSKNELDNLITFLTQVRDIL